MGIIKFIVKYVCNITGYYQSYLLISSKVITFTDKLFCFYFELFLRYVELNLFYINNDRNRIFLT